MIPAKDGLKTHRKNPDKYYGRYYDLREGWYAGYDSKEDITFVGAYPVDEPLYLHMWMNTPVNTGSRFYYVEFQPWTPLYQRNTRYFTYYLWGSGGPWKSGVKALRERNLVTESQNKE